MKRYIALIALAAALACSCSKYYDGYYDPEYYKSSKEFLTLRNYSSDATVWFIPANGGPERKLVERVFRVKGGGR